MTQYISKDAVVAEIEKLIDEIYAGQPFDSLSREQQVALWYVKSILSSIDSFEVKEVDLDFMLHEYWNLSSKITVDCLESATMTKDEMINFAKHFFELGMAASNNAQKGE